MLGLSAFYLQLGFFFLSILYKTLDVCVSVVFIQIEYVTYVIIYEHVTVWKRLMVKCC